ncbi:MAG TPA: ABC transporter permease [Vicinamibacterales bacterium]|nr:ABC transporter permease [Vicinamibacterales bacterium]
MSRRRVAFVLRKELIELRRDPRLLVVLIVAPILQLTVLGYAATTDIRHVPIVVADGDRSPASRELVARFAGSPYFVVTGLVTTVREAGAYLERGAAWMAVAIPPDYGRRLAAGLPVTVQVVADGSDASSTTVALGYATRLIAAYADDPDGAALRADAPSPDPPGPAAAVPSSSELVSAPPARPAPPIEMTAGLAAPGAEAGGAAAAIEPQVRVWFNPSLESRLFMVPGVLALLLLVVTANLSAMGIVREREVGTLEQLNVTPLTRWELIAGKLLPYGAIGLVDILLVVAVATLWFEVPLRGSFLLLVGASLTYLLCTLGLGLFVSTISETQQQAMMTATFFFLIPMVFLSGFVFPIESMPEAIQPLTYLVPLRYYLIVVRGVFLKGVGLETLWPQIGALLVWGLAALSFAAARARKTAA